MIAHGQFLAWGFVTTLGIAGGWLGWRLGTNALYLREIDESYGDVPIRPRLLVRRKVWRVIWTVMGTAGGALAGLLILIAVAGQ